MHRETAAHLFGAQMAHQKTPTLPAVQANGGQTPLIQPLRVARFASERRTNHVAAQSAAAESGPVHGKESAYFSEEMGRRCIAHATYFK